MFGLHLSGLPQRSLSLLEALGRQLHMRRRFSVTWSGVKRGTDHSALVFYLTERLHFLCACFESQCRGAQLLFLSVQLLSLFLQAVSLSLQRFLLLFQLSGAQLQIGLLLNITKENCDWLFRFSNDFPFLLMSPVPLTFPISPIWTA